MVMFNYSTRELTAKVVYYGPGLCGKTTNLQYVYDNLPGSVKGKMLSLATKTDRTLFFDFLPIDLGEIRGMKTRIQLYTVPGQVFYNETRRLVLKGADGVVFVADSQKQMMEANLDSFRNLDENVRAHGIKLSELPLVIQFNKRDLPNLASIEDLNATLNKYNAPFYESIATTGIGVQDTLKAVTKLVLLHLTRKYDVRRPAAQAAEAPQSPARAPSIAAAHTRGAADSSPRPKGSPARTGPSAPILSRRAGEEAATRMLRTVPVQASALEGEEEVVELLDVVEEPAPVAASRVPSLKEVTDEAELLQGEEDREIEILEDKGEPGEDYPPKFEINTSVLPASKPAGAKPASPAAAGRIPASGRAAAGAPAVRIPAAASAGSSARSSSEVPAPAASSGLHALSSAEVSEVNEANELFAEGTEVARLDGRQPVEVVVPIEVRAGGKTRRFRLAIRLAVSEIGEPSS